MHAAHPRFSIAALDLFERPVRSRLPFRFGSATVDEAPQAFVRARIELEDGRSSKGWAAEMMMPKWFDKSPERSVEQNIEDLRRSLIMGASAYLSDRTRRTAFGHAAHQYSTLQAQGSGERMNALLMSYGAALIDRALLDALCRALDTNFATTITRNVVGLDASLATDLRGFAFDAFLAQLSPSPRIAVRHTVGLLDPLTRAEVVERPNDPLPVALDEVIERYRPRYLKLKLSGSIRDDAERLARIASILAPLPQYAVTLDANEQFDSVESVCEFLGVLGSDRRLARLNESTLYIEQPLPRDRAMVDVRAVASSKRVVIDESDSTYDAFPDACRHGYSGVSSKSCKGIYKSIVNAARCAADASGNLFLTAEDLTTQPGLATQHDLALVDLLGLEHVERNGHHYVAGFAGQCAPDSEQRAFVAAHSDLYAFGDAGAALIIRDGTISLGSLNVPGFASGALPDTTSMTSLERRASPGIQ